MAIPADDWDGVVERALRTDVPGTLRSDFAARTEHALRERRRVTSSPMTWLLAWCGLAVALIASHVLLAPDDYRTLLDGATHVLERFRPDLVIAVLLVTGAAEMLARRHAAPGRARS